MVLLTVFFFSSKYFVAISLDGQQPAILRVLFPAEQYPCYTPVHLFNMLISFFLIIGVTHFSLRRAVFNIVPNAIDYEVRRAQPFQRTFTFLFHCVHF
jgi:hypothetical protein